MGCTYYMWQLVFADIVNKKTKILHWHRRHSIYTCYDRHLTPDCIPDWPILFKLSVTCYPSTCNMPIDILVYSIVSTLLFCSYYFLTKICFYSCITICLHVIRTCTFPFILTHSLEVLTPWICTSRSLYITLLSRYLERITRLTRSRSSLTWSSLLGIFLLFFVPIAVIILCIGLGIYSIPLFICYHVWTFICSIAVILIHHSDYIACSITLGLACIRGVSSSRIYITNSHHDSVSTYFGKRGVTDFSWYHSQFDFQFSK